MNTRSYARGPRLMVCLTYDQLNSHWNFNDNLVDIDFLISVIDSLYMMNVNNEIVRALWRVWEMM